MSNLSSQGTGLYRDTQPVQLAQGLLMWGGFKVAEHGLWQVCGVSIESVIYRAWWRVVKAKQNMLIHCTCKHLALSTHMLLVDFRKFASCSVIVKRYAIIKFYIHRWILAIRPHRPPPLLYAVYNSHDLRGKYPFLAVRFQIYFRFQDFLLVSMTGLHGAVPGVNDNTWADDCKKIKYTSLIQC